MKRIRGYKYRAYPDSMQQEYFEKTFGCSRYVFNHYLDMRRSMWAEWHDNMSYTEMSRDLSHNLKKEKVWLKEADSTALQQTLRHLDAAYRNFLSKRGGYPRYKSKREAQSYRTMNVHDSIRIDKRYIRLPKAGNVKIRNTREFSGRILSATISKTAGGRYYISLQVEEEYEVLANNGGKIGLDAGLKNLYTDSNGETVAASRTLSRHEKKIKRLQRRLSRKEKGSKNREKARLCLAREHEKVADIRNDFQHKVTHRLSIENQVVCIEDLNVRGMIRNHRLAKSISDASWSGFYRKLAYKMEDHGGTLVKVPRTYPSSQLCSSCGYRNRDIKDLSIRAWTCPECGAVHDRDVNAAVNILRKGLEIMAA